MLEVNAILRRVRGTETNAGETFEAFLIAIKKLARDANLCDACLDSRLVTKVMSDFHDKETRMKLLATSPLPDLQKVTNLCRSEESAKLDKARMNRNQTELNVYRAHAKSRDLGPKSHDCRKCGQSTCPPRGLTVCPAKNKPCSKCSKKGHFTSMYYSKNRSQPQHDLPGSKKKSNGQIIKRARSVTSTITCDWPAPKIAITLHDANTKDFIGSFETTPDSLLAPKPRLLELRFFRRCVLMLIPYCLHLVKFLLLLTTRIRLC